MPDEFSLLAEEGDGAVSESDARDDDDDDDVDDDDIGEPRGDTSSIETLG